MTIRTRFAPSPTGMLHIGGARTALFNFLLARHHGGAFLLRIEDTDRARSTEAAVAVILDGLAWLALTPDEPPVFQSARAARHTEVAHQLLSEGRAYRCYATQADLAAMRADADAGKRPFRYDGRWRDKGPADWPENSPFAVRLKAPRTGETIVDDLVQGQVRVANAELDDMIILRSDGSPTYLHAVVVDDHDMAITHVVRGDDHLTNTFRQAQIYAAMGWDLPRFGHIPLIHGADGAKLSKRHGAQSITEFRDMGLLPEALCNYLVRLGWGHGDAEILDRAEQIALFDFDGIGRAASRLDPAKLAHVNAIWLRGTDDARLIAETTARFANIPGLTIDDTTRARLASLMPTLKERARNLDELAQSAAFVARPLPMVYDDKARALLAPEPTKALLAALALDLAATEFEPDALDATLRSFATARNQKLGQIAQPLRAALTGSTTSPPIDAVLIAFGPQETAARLAAAQSDG